MAGGRRQVEQVERRDGRSSADRREAGRLRPRATGVGEMPIRIRRRSARVGYSAPPWSGRPVGKATPKGATRSTSGRASANSSPYRSAMHPVTTSRAPCGGSFEKASTVSIDSWRAASMKAQVLTTTSSAGLRRFGRLESLGGQGPDQLVRVDLFFGQPNVSIQYRSATRTIYRGMRTTERPVGAPGRTVADVSTHGSHDVWRHQERRGRDLNPRTQLPRSTH